MRDTTVETSYKAPEYDESKINEYVRNVLSLEAVACKDWLTNKVDRSVTGRVARQQCQGEIQLPRATAVLWHSTTPAALVSPLP